MLRINNLKYDIKAYVTDSMLLDYAKKQICLKLKLKDSEIKELKLLRKNIDARQNIAYIFHVSFGLYNREKEQILLRKYHFVEKYTYTQGRFTGRMSVGTGAVEVLLC